MARTKKVTITEIANATGVSKTTVSRYLNGQTGLMSEKTAEKIKSVIELCDYHPSEFARALKSNKTKMIGVVIADIKNPWSSSVISECGDRLLKNGYTPLFFNSNDSLENEKRVVDLLANKGVDGFIVNTSSYSNRYLMEYSFKGYPIVLCDRFIKDYPCDSVIPEMQRSMRELIQHLHQQGFTRPIMFSQEWKENSARFKRIEAYRDAMLEEYGYYNPEDVFTILVRNSTDALSQLESFMKKVAPGERVAIIGVNTMTMLRVFNCIQRLGLQIPKDVGLCGPDDWDWDDTIRLTSLLYPEITTIKINAREIGRQCADLMIRRLQEPEKEIEVIEIPSRLSIHASTML